MGKDYYNDIDQHDLFSPKSNLMKNTKEQILIATTREDALFRIFEQIDKVGTDDENFEVFGTHTKNLQPSQLLSFWIYILTRKVRNERIEQLFTNIDDLCTQEELGKLSTKVQT